MIKAFFAETKEEAVKAATQFKDNLDPYQQASLWAVNTQEIDGKLMWVAQVQYFGLD